MSQRACKFCGGPLVLLGTLGWLTHVRCQACGAQFSLKARKRVRRNSAGGEAVVVVADPSGSKHTLSSFKGAGSALMARSHVRSIRHRAAHGGDYFTGWRAGYAVLKNTKAGIRSIDIDNFGVLGSGKIAHYISPVGNYGPSPKTGMTVVRFALFRMANKEAQVDMAKVMYANGRTSEGSPGSILPESVLRVVQHGSRFYLPGHDRKIRLWGISKGVSMNRKTRRNPHSLEVAWTGKRAGYVSPVGNYGTTGHSELAMHTGGAGKAVVRFALWKRPAKGWSGPADAVQWAQVEYPNGKVLDGTPHEVLPPEVLRIIGRGNYGSPKMPRRKEKLQLWALSKGVAANRGRKNPLTQKETKEVLRAMRSSAMTVRMAPTGGERILHLGKIAGMATVAEYYGRGKARKYASRMRVAAASMATKPRRVRKNIGHGHPVWQAGAAAHKFMSYLDDGHLRVWRDLPLVTVMHGGTPAKRAFEKSVATVRERMKTLATTLQSIDGLRAYRTLLKTPLRAVAGAWGLMEVMRSDF